MSSLTQFFGGGGFGNLYSFKGGFTASAAATAVVTHTHNLGIADGAYILPMWAGNQAAGYFSYDSGNISQNVGSSSEVGSGHDTFTFRADYVSMRISNKRGQNQPSVGPVSGTIQILY
jgi:hypothetical protein